MDVPRYLGLRVAKVDGVFKRFKRLCADDQQSGAMLGNEELLRLRDGVDHQASGSSGQSKKRSLAQMTPSDEAGPISSTGSEKVLKSDSGNFQNEIHSAGTKNMFETEQYPFHNTNHCAVHFKMEDHVAMELQEMQNAYRAFIIKKSRPPKQIIHQHVPTRRKNETKTSDLTLIRRVTRCLHEAKQAGYSLTREPAEIRLDSKEAEKKATESLKDCMEQHCGPIG